MTGNPLELFRKFFGAVRAIFWLWGSLLAPGICQGFPNLPFVKFLSGFAEVPYQVPPWSLPDAPKNAQTMSKEAYLVPTPKARLYRRVRVANFANPPASYRSLSGPLGPKSQKGLKKVSRPLAPGSPKVRKKSRKSPEQTFSRLFPETRLLGTPGPEAPGDFSSDFFLGFRARWARETPVAGGRVRNAKCFPGCAEGPYRGQPLSPRRC